VEPAPHTPAGKDSTPRCRAVARDVRSMNLSPYKTRCTENLRSGRISDPGARYFLTWCTSRRAALLAMPAVQETAIRAITSIDSSNDGAVLAASIMPDHIHILLELGERLTVSQLVGKTKSAVSRAHRETKWQENFFEHRLRPNDLSEPFAFYVFMNPYCARICSLEQIWRGWIRSRTVRWEFEDKLHADGLPQPEWTEQAEIFGAALPKGAE
jgi:putative transposase